MNEKKQLMKDLNDLEELEVKESSMIKIVEENNILKNKMIQIEQEISKGKEKTRSLEEETQIAWQLDEQLKK